jgi:mono/diheme cytochrome c family protein
VNMVIRRRRSAVVVGATLLGAGAILTCVMLWTQNADARVFRGKRRHHHAHRTDRPPPLDPGWAGAWFWQRSPEQEHRVLASLYNRYCIRCHGIDGRGVWDIPDVPDFSNTRWQATRPDGYLARVIIEGRGAVMPPFRGTFTLEESWAMARYVRSFMPQAAISRPELGSDGPPNDGAVPGAEAPVADPPPPLAPDTAGPFTRRS